MIRAAFERNAQGQLTGCSVKGHSGYADAGYDIVCAGVSVLVTTCVNSLEALCGLSTDETVTGTDDGFLSFRLSSPLSDETMHDAQLLMENLHLGLVSMAEEYPGFVKVKGS